MKRIDTVTAIVTFMLIILIFGAIGGVDSEALTIGQGTAAVVVFSALIAADIKIGEAVKRRWKKSLCKSERRQTLKIKKGA